MIYLDNSATTKPYEEVLDAFLKVSRDYFGNPSSLHSIGGKAEKLLEQARSQVAGLLKVKSSEIIFTSGGTEANNLAIKGAALANQHRGNHIITTQIEHPSVYESVKDLEQRGFEATYLQVDQNGVVDIEELKRAIRPETILVSIIHVNNEAGTIQPIEEIGQILKAYPKILFHADHVQGAGKVPLDFKKASLDMVSLSGHKFHALKGTGALYVREGVSLDPLFSGGGQESRRRHGTENVAGIVSFAKALRMTSERWAANQQLIDKTAAVIRSGLASIPEVTIHSPARHSAPHIINFSVADMKAEVFVHALEAKGVYVSTTSACSSKKSVLSRTLLAMGVPEKLAESAMRISLSEKNTPEEAEEAVKIIADTAKHLGKVMN